MISDSCTRIHYFTREEIENIDLPEKFTFPFFYEPHPLAVLASGKVQRLLESDRFQGHNFGLDNRDGMAIGKMFGVLIVQDTSGRTGYLAAFSGKLAETNEHPEFVPPVFDMLTEGSFFLKEQYLLNTLNERVKVIEQDRDYLQLKENHIALEQEALKEVNTFKEQLRVNKASRKMQRTAQKAALTAEAYAAVEAHLIKHSLHDKHQLRLFEERYEALLRESREKLENFESEIAALKAERRERSAALQQQLFEQYTFLNRDGERKSLYDIFSKTVFGKPPAAAGECATPKLLQFAFANGYEPLAMAEFWWGASPKSEVRTHGHFYPACTGKCKPILEHMLEGMAIDDNPLLHNPGKDKKLEIVYEDDSFVVVNKPAELLSVPGIAINDSVYTRLKYLWKDVEPLIIHRLDMATSGLLVVAKTAAAHKAIQRQFLKRTVKKRYSALLSGSLLEEEGEVSLPLRGDIDDRPRQMVCFDFGKPAITRWKAISTAGGTTKVHFWPLTGRTHQLRMHAAHTLGLNMPIVGDDLYGTAAERLYLHAAFLEFTHPETGKVVTFKADEDF